MVKTPCLHCRGYGFYPLAHVLPSSAKKKQKEDKNKLILKKKKNQLPKLRAVGVGIDSLQALKKEAAILQEGLWRSPHVYALRATLC